MGATGTLLFDYQENDTKNTRNQPDLHDFSLLSVYFLSMLFRETFKCDVVNLALLICEHLSLDNLEVTFFFFLVFLFSWLWLILLNCIDITIFLVLHRDLWVIVLLVFFSYLCFNVSPFTLVLLLSWTILSVRQVAFVHMPDHRWCWYVRLTTVCYFCYMICLYVMIFKIYSITWLLFFLNCILLPSVSHHYSILPLKLLTNLMCANLPWLLLVSVVKNVHFAR